MKKFRYRVKFTKASVKDKDSRVTLNVGKKYWKQFIGNSQFIVLDIHSSRAMSHEVLFRMNRKGKTFKTTSWPATLPVPQVGAPINLGVESLRAL